MLALFCILSSHKRADMGIRNPGRLRHSVGIETGHGIFTPLILKGTPLPSR
jgi:hypothetical protein